MVGGGGRQVVAWLFSVGIITQLLLVAEDIMATNPEIEDDATTGDSARG